MPLNQGKSEKVAVSFVMRVREIFVVDKSPILMVSVPLCTNSTQGYTNHVMDMKDSPMLV